MAMTDSFSSLSLPARRCSTTNRRNRDSRPFRENTALDSIRSNCSRTARSSSSPRSIPCHDTFVFSRLQYVLNVLSTPFPLLPLSNRFTLGGGQIGIYERTRQQN